MTQLTARDCAVKILLRVENERSFAAAVLEAELPKLANDKDISLATQLVYGVLRNKLWLNHLLDSAAKNGLEKIDPIIMCILRVATYQLVFLDRIPNRAAVNEAVIQTKNSQAPQLSSLVNALLRNLGRRTPAELVPRENFVEKEPETGALKVASTNKIATELLSLNFSIPKWLCGKVIKECGQIKAAEILSSFKNPSRRSLRVNTKKTSVEEILKKLDKEGSKGLYLPWSINVSSRTAARELEAEGLAVNQDEGAGLIVLALNPKSDETILDACAGRGGKTGAIAMLTNNNSKSKITAADKKGSKLERLVFELAKQDLKVEIKVIDLIDKSAIPNEQFDAVLLDAPCSGTGTIGRRPEIRWNLQPQDLDSLLAIQHEMLRNIAPLVKPGGRLVFAVCSILKKENEGHLKTFLEENVDFYLQETPPSAWPKDIDWNKGAPVINPNQTGTDGYRMLCFKRK